MKTARNAWLWSSQKLAQKGLNLRDTCTLPLRVRATNFAVRKNRDFNAESSWIGQTTRKCFASAQKDVRCSKCFRKQYTISTIIPSTLQKELTAQLSSLSSNVASSSKLQRACTHFMSLGGQAVAPLTATAGTISMHVPGRNGLRPI